jgi:hypothetical protein
MKVNEKKVKEMDSHWNDVMNLAEQYGFIGLSYGGVTILVTHESQRKMWGDGEYIRRQWEMHRNEMADNGRE